MALGSDKGSVTLTDFPAGTEVQDVSFPTSVRQLSFSADGRFLAIAGDSKSRVWDRREKAFITGELVHPARVDSVVFSPHGDRLVTGCWDAHVRVFAVDGSAAQPLIQFRPDEAGKPDDDKKPVYPTYIDEGSKLLTVQGTQLIWSDAKNGKRIRSIPVPELTRPTVTLSAQGKYAAVHGGKSGNAFVQMIDLEKGETVGPILKHSNEVRCLAFSPDGKALVSGSMDRTVRLWAVPSGEPLTPPLVHPASVLFVAISPDGRTLLTLQEDGQVRVWAFPRNDPSSYRVPLDGRNSFAILSRDGKYLLAAGMNEYTAGLASTHVVDVASRRPAGPELRPGDIILGAAFSPDGRQVAVITGRQDKKPRVHLWDWRTGTPTSPPVPLPSEPRSLSYRPDGLCLAVYCADGQLLQLDPKSGRILRQWSTPTGPHSHTPTHFIHGNGAVRFSPDGKRLFIWGLPGAGTGGSVYEAEKDLPHAILSLDPQCHGLGFSPDGRFFAVASFDHTARVFDYATGGAVGDALQHPDWVFDARFSSDGRYLLTACRDGMARVCNWKDCQLVGPPMEHRDEVLAAAFTPDGQWVVTASLDRTARAWDWPTGKPLTPPLPLSGRGLTVAVTPDSKYAVVGGFVEALEVICLDDLSSDHELDAVDLCLWAELCSGQRVHDGGGVNNLTATEWLNRWQLFHRAHPDYGILRANDRSSRNDGQ